VFGGEVGKSHSFTIYAGSLDDPSSFHPKIAIFARSRPHWAVLPPDVTFFDAMPPTIILRKADPYSGDRYAGRKRVNSLAVRLPAAVVEALELHGFSGHPRRLVDFRQRSQQ
jgi:hypothetical protein